MEVKHISVFVDTAQLPRSAINIIQKIRVTWKYENIKFKIFSNGITNNLIGFYCENEPTDIILVRIYGEKTDLFVDRVAEIENFKLMYSKNYAPKLYVTFENGLAYDYVHGEVLNIETCRNPNIYPLVASMLAKMHKIVYQRNVSDTPMIWKKCKCFIDLIPEQYYCRQKQLQFTELFPFGKTFFMNEYEELKKKFQHVNNPIVFCHNDLLLANVIHRDNKSVIFIDYEYAGLNYQAFDIANHFIEFAGVSDFDSSLYPSKEFQLNWIKIYLKEFNEDSTHVNQKIVDELYSHVCRFLPVSHFIWAMWALVQAHYSCINFDYLKYAKLRFHEYRKIKDAYL